jgi:TIR domain
MRAIFMSYRREDTEGQAGRLFDDLARHFGEHSVFMDVAGIEPGRDFRRVIDEHVSSCGVLLAMIGKSWIDAKDGSGRRRLDDPMDFVRLETASALKRDIPVIPVLVHGANMPRAEQLPEDLAELAYRNGVEVTHVRWDSDVQVLIKALGPYVESAEKNSGRGNGAPANGASKARTMAAAISADASQNFDGAQQAGLPEAKKSLATIVAAVAAALVIAAGGYLWYQVSFERARMVRHAALLEEAKKKAAAEQLEAKRRTEEKGMADALEAKKYAAEKALAAEMEAKGRAQERALGARRQAQEREYAQELETKRRAQQLAEAEKRAAEKRAQEIALAEKREAETQARERAAAAERERMRIAQERAAAAQRARWPSYNFPPPNGGLLVYTIMPDGNPACASYDGGGCLWGVTYDQIDFRRLKPLVCGEQHRARFGVTGYENLRHWCSLARRLRDRR